MKQPLPVVWRLPFACSTARLCPSSSHCISAVTNPLSRQASSQALSSYSTNAKSRALPCLTSHLKILPNCANRSSTSCWRVFCGIRPTNSGISKSKIFTPHKSQQQQQPKNLKNIKGCPAWLRCFPRPAQFPKERASESTASRC